MGPFEAKKRSRKSHAWAPLTVAVRCVACAHVYSMESQLSVLKFRIETICILSSARYITLHVSIRERKANCTVYSISV